ncbi:MAG: hypothetical protein QXW35_03525 [Candidatus Aenigmatarchaeota archaeon]
MKELTFTGLKIKVGSGKDVLLMKDMAVIPQETNRFSKVYDYTNKTWYHLHSIPIVAISDFYQENYLKIIVY